MSENHQEVNVKVLRFNPAREKEARYQTYIVPLAGQMSVLNVLQYITEHYDGGLAYYASCRIGKCTGCTVRVNGKARLACTELVQGDLTLEPVSRGRVVKDLLIKPAGKEEPV